MNTLNRVQYVVKITAITSEEDTSGGFITQHRQVDGIIIDSQWAEKFTGKVGDEVEWCEWIEQEGIYGHLILKGLGTIVYINV